MLTFAVPAALASLLALPIVVLLHRLRARRERRDAAGTFLWTRAQKQGATRPRLRTTLLLLLQLLATLAVALATARPYLASDPAPTRILVIDTFASMATRDGVTSLAAEDEATARAISELPRDATRLDVARRIALHLADGARDTAIIQAGAAPTLLLAPTRDPTLLRDALATLQAVDATRDPARALTLARDMAGRLTDPDGPEIHWLSDQLPPSQAGVRHHDLAGSGRNVGITGFERVAGQAWIRLASNEPRPTEVLIDLQRGDTTLASTSVLIPARGETSFTLAVPGDAGILVARIRHDGDALPLDDEAWSGESRTVVTLDAPLRALERALGAIDGIDLRVTPAAASIPADLHVLTRSQTRSNATITLTMPAADAPATAATVNRWNASDPLLRFVDLSDLTVAYVTPSDVAHADPDPAHVLVSGTTPQGTVPLATRIEHETGTHIHLAFHPTRGDLTLRPAWPTLVVNLVDGTRNATRIPLGTRFDPPAQYDGVPVSQARTPGAYLVDGRTVHASLLAPAATNAPTRDTRNPEDRTPTNQQEVATPAADRIERALPQGWTTPLPGRDLTPLLLALAFVALWSEAWVRRALRAP